MYSHKREPTPEAGAARHNRHALEREAEAAADAIKTRMLRLVAVGDSAGCPGEAAENRSVALFAGVPRALWRTPGNAG